jgi:hypothetical protein
MRLQDRLTQNEFEALLDKCQQGNKPTCIYFQANGTIGSTRYIGRVPEENIIGVYDWRVTPVMLKADLTNVGAI